MTTPEGGGFNDYIKKKRINNRFLEIVIFLIVMLSLMINDAINHPKDFEEGFNQVTNKKVEVNK